MSGQILWKNNLKPYQQDEKYDHFTENTPSTQPLLFLLSLDKAYNRIHRQVTVKKVKKNKRQGQTTAFPQQAIQVLYTNVLGNAELKEHSGQMLWHLQIQSSHFDTLRMVVFDRQHKSGLRLGPVITDPGLGWAPKTFVA